jgi:hypothetical protein
MKTCIVLFSILLAFFLVGCGGSGGSGKGSEVVFAVGSYSGPWTSTDSQSGTSAIVVANNGSFTGTFYNQGLNLTGTISGQIVSDGSFEGTITLGGNDYEGTGQFVLSQNGDVMDGTMVYNSVTFTFNFTRD